MQTTDEEEEYWARMLGEEEPSRRVTPSSAIFGTAATVLVAFAITAYESLALWIISMLLVPELGIGYITIFAVTLGIRMLVPRSDHSVIWVALLNLALRYLIGVLVAVIAWVAMKLI